MFVPPFRVERVFLDEPVGEVESYQQRFSGRVGVPVQRYLGLGGEDAAAAVEPGADAGEVPS